MAAPNEMTSYRAPENTDLHTRLAGASEPEYSKLPTDITTAGVNLVGLSLELLTLSLSRTHTCTHHSPIWIPPLPHNFFFLVLLLALES